MDEKRVVLKRVILMGVAVVLVVPSWVVWLIGGESQVFIEVPFIVLIVLVFALFSYYAQVFHLNKTTRPKVHKKLIFMAIVLQVAFPLVFLVSRYVVGGRLPPLRLDPLTLVSNIAIAYLSIWLLYEMFLFVKSKIT